MIQLSEMPFQQNSLWQSGSLEDLIFQQMQKETAVFSFFSIKELSFEIRLRKNIITMAKALNESNAKFSIFQYARCNPRYWYLTAAGGFRLKPNIRPSDAILDIFKNSSLYAFECATACVIIIYIAVLKSIGVSLFNQLFQNLYLYSWHADPDLRIHTFYANHFLPGDVVYFNNPDFDPKYHWYRGVNAVALTDGNFFGHGFGIRTGKEMIQILNNKRNPNSNKSAYLTNLVTRPYLTHLAAYTPLQRIQPAYKLQPIVIHHNKSSISFERYLFIHTFGYDPF